MLLRSTLIYLPALLLPRIATFALVIVATRLLPIAEYGLFALVTVVGEIAEGVSTNWLRIGLLRFSGGAATFPAPLWREAARTNRLTTLAALICILPVAFILVPDRAPAFWGAVAAYVIAMALLRFGLGVLQATGSRASYATIESARALAVLAFPVAAVLLLSRDFLTASLAGSAATLIFSGWALMAARRRVGMTDDRADPRAMRVYAAPIVAATGVGYLVASIERMVLQVLAGAASVGAYSAAQALARQPLETLGNAVNTGGFPQLVSSYERDGERGAREAVGTQLDMLLTLLIPGIVGLAVLREPIAEAILPTAYHDAVVATLPWIALGAACSALRTTVFDSLFHLQKRSWMVFAYMVPAALISLAVAITTIPVSGAEGAAWAFAAGSAASLPLAIVPARRFVPRGRAVRSLGGACLAALAVGLGAGIGASLAPSLPILQLGAGLLSGGIAFLASQAALRPQRAVAILRRVPMLAPIGR